MTLTAAKQQEKLNGQTSVAQKVFQFVPIQDAWSVSEISAELSRSTGSRIDFRVVSGCLGALKSAKLVHEPEPGKFKRNDVGSSQKGEVKAVEETKEKDVITQAGEIASSLRHAAEILQQAAVDVEGIAIAIDDKQKDETKELHQLRQLRALLKGMS